MDIERVAPELRASILKAPKVSVENALIRRISRIAIRFLPAAKVPGVRAENVTDRGLRLRLYRPESPTGAALLWIHGGGMVIGGPKQDDRICAETAARLGALVVSVDYRLAPEHPHPAPLDDCARAWRWLQDSADRLGVDAGRVAIGGESAGGGLAAALAQRLRDEGGVQPVAQWLVYPMLDDRTAARRELDDVDHWIWTNRSNRFGWRSLLGVEPGAAEVAAYAVAARREDLSGLPPAWIGVGDIDLFHDEDLEYADRLVAAGGVADVVVLPGGPHGFFALAPDAAPVERFRDRAIEWLGERIAASA